MINTFIRAIILYILVLITMRLMGKRELGQLQPFELAVAIMIADLASIPMADTGVPLYSGIIPILVLLILQVTISTINLKSNSAKRILSGQSRVLICKGKIDEKALKKERLSINELQERLREKDVFSLGDVEYAILETSGKVTVIQKPEKRNVMPEDLSIYPEYEGLAYDLVIDGVIMHENLKVICKEEKWLRKEVEKFGFSPEQALIVTYDGKGQMFCQKKGEKK